MLTQPGGQSRLPRSCELCLEGLGAGMAEAGCIRALGPLEREGHVHGMSHAGSSGRTEAFRGARGEEMAGEALRVSEGEQKRLRPGGLGSPLICLRNLRGWSADTFTRVHLPVKCKVRAEGCSRCSLLQGWASSRHPHKEQAAIALGYLCGKPPVSGYQHHLFKELALFWWISSSISKLTLSNWWLRLSFAFS